MAAAQRNMTICIVIVTAKSIGPVIKSGQLYGYRGKCNAISCCICSLGALWEHNITGSVIKEREI